MEERLKKYTENLAKIAASADSLSAEEKERQRELALVQIRFFQHERLIHLIVTVTFAIMTLLSVLGFILSGQMSLLILIVLLLVLLVPYIRHYYLLENGVQKLYTYYDKLS